MVVDTSVDRAAAMSSGFQLMGNRDKNRDQVACTVLFVLFVLFGSLPSFVLHVSLYSPASGCITVCEYINNNKFTIHVNF